MRITYFVNQYPKVSHSFIRREILALERQGFIIQRMALRGWDAQLLDADDMAERDQTQYVLQGGLRGLIKPLLQVLRADPRRFYRILAGLALGLARRPAIALPRGLPG